MQPSDDVATVLDGAVTLTFSATRRLPGDMHIPVTVRNRFGRASLSANAYTHTGQLCQYR